MQQFQHVNPVALRSRQHRRGVSTGVLLTPGLLGPAFGGGGDVHHHAHAPHSTQYYDFKPHHPKLASKNACVAGGVGARGQQHGFVPNVLYMLVTSLNVDWTSVARRVRSHPSEAHVRDRYGRTVLHHAVRRYRPSSTSRTFASGVDGDAREREYRGAVGAIVAANPGAATARNDAGETPLLVACGAAGMIESQSPITTASEGSSSGCLSEVLKMLLVHNPHTVRMVDGAGNCPLSALWAGYRGAFERMMVPGDGGGDVVAFVTSCLGNSNCQERDQDPEMTDGIESNESNAAAHDREENERKVENAAIEAARPLARAFWRQATLLLQAKYQWTKMHRSPVFRPVHAAAEACCCASLATPVRNNTQKGRGGNKATTASSKVVEDARDSGVIAILRIAAGLHPDELTRLDGRGRTPLLVAISGTAAPKQSPNPRHRGGRKKVVNARPCPFANLEDHPSLTEADRSTKAESLKARQAKEEEREREREQRATSAPVNASAMAAVDALLGACPRAASMPDSNGRLPLFHLIENLSAGGRHVRSAECLSLWGLVKASPEALRARDAGTARTRLLYPFMLSAVGAGEANVTYELLRALPEVVQGCFLCR